MIYTCITAVVSSLYNKADVFSVILHYKEDKMVLLTLTNLGLTMRKDLETQTVNSGPASRPLTVLPRLDSGN